MERKDVYYSDYLQLNKLLNCQQPESASVENGPAHDEMLFIVIHQAYELWFKQVLYEVDSAIEIMKQRKINDNTADLQTVVHRLKRVNTILQVLVQQIDILETMTPMDFLEFRDLLRPASGFQSWQFKVLEARLGLTFKERFGQEYYISQLKQPEIDIIKNAEEKKSLLQVVNQWLERIPFFESMENWQGFEAQGEPVDGVHPFWATYRERYKNSLSEVEKNNLKSFDEIFITGKGIGQLTAKSCRAALFILLYRGFPILHLPFELLNNLLELDNQMGTWRYRHVNMVQRMIGTRAGTGGSTGKDYLRSAMDKHYIFKDFIVLSSFLIERSRLPVLPPSVTQFLSFNTLSTMEN